MCLMASKEILCPCNECCLSPHVLHATVEVLINFFFPFPSFVALYISHTRLLSYESVSSRIHANYVCMVNRTRRITNLSKSSVQRSTQD